MVILTGPILGVIIGGLIINRLGGYTSPTAIKVVLIYGLLAGGFGLPFPLVNSFYLAVSFLWLMLFFGGCLIPCVMGIMISSVPKYLRSFANSNA